MSKAKANLEKELSKIIEENQETKELLEDFKNITSEQLKYAKNSRKMFEEENESFYYLSIVFQNNKACQEFCDRFKDFLGLADGDQMFVNGHDLAKRLGKPLKTPYVRKTVQLDKLRDAQMISKVGIYEN